MVIARDVYGRHPYELTRQQIWYTRELIALALLEGEEWEQRRKG